MFLSCLTGISIDDLYLAPEHSNNFASEKVWNVRTMKRQNYEKTRQLHGLLSLKRCFTQLLFHSLFYGKTKLTVANTETCLYSIEAYLNIYSGLSRLNFRSVKSFRNTV